MRIPVLSVAASVVLAASTVANVQAQNMQSQQNVAASQNAQAKSDAHVKAMADLERAAQRLRESIQTMAQLAPGRDRNVAIDAANKALLDANQAMAEFGPPAPKKLPMREPVLSLGSLTYDEAVNRLKQATDKLYDAVHDLARAPAGMARNDAIKAVDHALLDTQAAIAWTTDQKFTSTAQVGARGSVTARAGGSVSGTATGK